MVSRPELGLDPPFGSGRESGRDKDVSYFEGALLVEGHEKGNCRFRIQMPNLSAGKGRALEARWKDTAPSDSCIEVG